MSHQSPKNYFPRRTTPLKESTLRKNNNIHNPDDLAGRITKEANISMDDKFAEWTAEQVKTESGLSNIDQIAKESQGQIQQRVSKENATWTAYQALEPKFLKDLAQKARRMVTRLEFYAFKEECEYSTARVEIEKYKYNKSNWRNEMNVEKEWKVRLEENKRFWADKAMNFMNDEESDDDDVKQYISRIRAKTANELMEVV